MTLDQLSAGRFELGVGTGVADGDALAQDVRTAHET